MLYTVFFMLTFLSVTANEYQMALVRELSPQFENSLKKKPPKEPIHLEKAIQQHNHYIEILQQLVPFVLVIQGDPNYPDCNFIEDTAIIVGKTAVISSMGAESRRGEELAVHAVLQHYIPEIHLLEKPALMDGGDILYTNKHLIVGLSERTNIQAYFALKEIFKEKVEVIAIPVTEGLHLKSILSYFAEDTLIVADTPAGERIREALPGYQFIKVPDPVSSNALRISSTLLIQEGYPESERILEAACQQEGLQLIKINMSELIKADGALTCGSLLFNPSITP